ncbi:MAG TPA: FHA domain-containing protein [Pseudomonadota bacterium]|nr:FHA domain-containing protein [Pseudomonadota bacterium]
MARFRLRMRTMEINLPLGEIIIGRGPECYLRVDEPMVSRRHARLRVTPSAVVLEDLGSRNGSRVNGINATAPVTLNSGDILGVGTQQFTLEREDDPSPHRPTVNYTPQWNAPPAGSPVSVASNVEDTSTNPVSVASVSTFSTAGSNMTNPGLPGGMPGSMSMSNVPSLDPGTLLPDGPTHVSHNDGDASDQGQSANRGSAYRLFWGLSDKVLAMGRIEEAERMMGPRLTEMRTRAEAGDAPEEPIITEALRRSLRLAAATKKDQWFAWIFDYARLCKYKMPLPLLDEIYAQVFVGRPAIGPKIVAYAQTIDDEVIVVRLATLRRLCRE